MIRLVALVIPVTASIAVVALIRTIVRPVSVAAAGIIAPVVKGVSVIVEVYFLVAHTILACVA